MEKAFAFKWLESEKMVTNIKYYVKMVNTKLYCYYARDASRWSCWTGWEAVAPPTRMQEGHTYSVQPLSFPSSFSLSFSSALTQPKNFLLSGSFANSVTYLPALSGWLERRWMGRRVGVAAELPSVHAAVLMDGEETASPSSVLLPLPAQGKPCCCRGAGGLAVLPFLPEPRLTGLGMAAVEWSYEGQGCRARGGCLRRCLCKQKMQVLGKWGKGPGGSALMRLWGVWRTS